MRLNIPRQIAELHDMDVPALRQQWRVLYGAEAPAYNKPFLIKRLAYRIQELAHGGLSDQTKRKLKEALKLSDQDENGSRLQKHQSRKKQRHAVGTQFVREYQGQRCVVTAVEGGYEFEHQVYRSLSAVAREITGTQWNGPAFFGLRNEGGRS